MSFSPILSPTLTEVVKTAVALSPYYVCCRPSRYYLRDLVEYMYRVMRFHNVHIIPITPFFK